VGRREKSTATRGEGKINLGYYKGKGKMGPNKTAIMAKGVGYHLNGEA